jgi:pantetheine-phosphate adenylyltransferase
MLKTDFRTMKVCIGGTFDIIHKGHEKLIEKAFKTAGENGFVFIGLSKGPLIKDKDSAIRKWSLRKKKLQELVNERNYASDFEITPISDIYGPTIKEDFDAIIVSPETVKNAEKINLKRKEIGKKPIKIIKIPYVLAEDNIPISSSRIKKGEITPQGKNVKD